jgi:hypothetical protein
MTILPKVSQYYDPWRRAGNLWLLNNCKFDSKYLEINENILSYCVFVLLLAITEDLRTLLFWRLEEREFVE